MKWKTETLHGIESIYNNRKYRPYTDAIDNKEIGDFSEDLDDLLSRLASIMIVEMGMEGGVEGRLHNQEKIKKILEMAAVGGRTL
jgi:hypothetical protein